MAAKKNQLFTDTAKLRQLTNSIAEQAEGFAADAERLKECLERLQVFWKSEAATAYAVSLSEDMNLIEAISAVFSELAGNYRYALNEYEKSACRTMDIISALKI